MRLVPGRAVAVRVPATSANLGPGFDALGLALGLHDDVVVRVADAGLAVDVAGEGADDVARNERHLVVRAMRAAFDRLGGQPRGLEVVCANRIPHGRGLGSSAAAICAGVVAARALTSAAEQLLDDAAVLALATELEGHPDNVAACLLGGLTIAWTDADGAPRGPARPGPAGRARWCSCPSTDVLTDDRARTAAGDRAARRRGRQRRPLRAAGRGADPRPDLLLDATEDRLHQAYRASAMPRSAALVDELRAAGVAAVVSGAGPTRAGAHRSADAAA